MESLAGSLALLALGFFFGFSSPSFAEEAAPVLVPNYNCEVIAIAGEAKDVLDQKFKADYASGMHGGREYTFENSVQKVTLLASNNWMAVRWEKNGEVIAFGHYATSKPSDDYRVILMLNPKNEEEQVSLECHPENFDPNLKN